MYFYVIQYTASKVTDNLVTMARQVYPGDVVSTGAVRSAMGISKFPITESLQESIKSGSPSLGVGATAIRGTNSAMIGDSDDSEDEDDDDSDEVDGDVGSDVEGNGSISMDVSC